MHHFGAISHHFGPRFQCEKVQQSAILCDHSGAEPWAMVERMAGPTTCYRRMVNRAFSFLHRDLPVPLPPNY